MTKRLKSSASVTPVSTGTRDAVESAIDFSKGNKFATWEESVDKNLSKITKWEEQPKRESA